MKQTPNYYLPQFIDEDKFNKEDFNDAFNKIEQALSDTQDSINWLEPTSVEYIRVLAERISKAEEVKKDTEQLIKNGGAVPKSELEKTNASLLTTINEILNARKGEVNLKSKIDNIDATSLAILTEIINARKGSSSLKNKIDSIDLDLSEAKTEIINARKGEVNLKNKIDNIDINLTNRALKTEVFSMANMGQDVRTAMTGGAVSVVSDNAVLRNNIVNKQVTTSKLANSKIVSRNIFNITELTLGKWLSYSNGTLAEQNPLYPQSTSDFISILPSTTYYRSHDSIIVFYDNSFKYISGIDLGTFTYLNKTVTSPSNASYCRIGMTTSDSATFMFAKSTVELPYEPFIYELTNISIAKESLPILNTEKLNLFNQINISDLVNIKVASKNIFNKGEMQLKKWLDYSNGNLKDENPLYPQSTSEFTPILPSTTYYRSHDSLIAYFDKNFNFISGINLGVFTYLNKTITSPSNASYCRIGITTTDADTFMFAQSSSPVPYEPYKFEFTNIKISKESLPLLSIESLDILRVGKNIFDKSKATRGKYISYLDGSLLNEHPSYPVYYSDYIEIDNTKPSICRSDDLPMAFYDENKNFIIGDASKKALPIPSNAKFVRVSVLVDLINTYQVEYSTAPTNFNEYKVAIPMQYIPSIDVDTGNSGSVDKLIMHLPKEIVILKGRIIELYHKQICHTGNIENFHFHWKTSIGKPFKRKFQIDTNTIPLGVYPIILEVYNNNLEFISSLNLIVKIIEKTSNNSQLKVMCIGDSLTYNSGWRKEVKKIIDSAYGINKIKYIGTLGNEINYKHEGRAGWTCANYLANSEYIYSSNIILTVIGVTTIPVSKKIYIVPDNEGGHEWEVERCEITGGNGKIFLNRKIDGVYRPLDNGTIIAKETSTVGNTSISYSSYEFEKGNPFWNTTTNQLDFNNYLTSYGLEKPDIVTIMLGTNDIADPTVNDYDTLKTTFQSIINNLKTLIDTLITQWVGVKILLMLPPYFSGQDGIAMTYPAHNSRNLEIKLHLMIYTLTDMITKQFEDYNSNLKIVPISQTHDSDYNFGIIEIPVNPRLTTIKHTIPLEATHPTIEGEYQMADIISGAIVNLD